MIGRRHPFCRNCRVPIRWGLWCDDCVRMVLKCLIAQAIAGGAAWMLRR